MKTMNFKHFNIIMVIAFCLFVFGQVMLLLLMIPLQKKVEKSLKWMIQKNQLFKTQHRSSEL